MSSSIHAWTLLSTSLVLASPVFADEPQQPPPQPAQPQPQPPSPELDRMRDELTDVRSQLAAMKAKLDERKDEWITRKPGDALTFAAGSHEITIYGNLDISLDDTTKGLDATYAQGGSPTGNMGWLPAVSTNISYIGVRGRQPIGAKLAFVYQLETQLDLSATAGTVNTNSNSDDIVKGALTSRDTYVGFSGAWGSIKVGKTFAPYKNSTQRMNPFVGMIGDYSVIMGNTGGDNRAEFLGRLDHAIWYESPSLGGLTFAALVSPGQNRSYDESDIPAGEAGCSGGNIPGSGALSPACNDGSFGTAYSVDVAFEHGPFYAAAAYELHRNVNRVSDLENDPRDIGNEEAAKFGIEYALPTRTQIMGIFELMHRALPSELEDQNERSRNGSWIAVSQEIGPRDRASAGWAHAFSTPGDPGQHNEAGGANPDNAADMVTLMFRHAFDHRLSTYVTAAATVNHADAHFDLGAGGRSVTTDCHDATQLAAFDATTGMVSGSGPFCYTGGHLLGVSAGVNLRF